MIHAPIKYFGGKSLMLGKIYPYFPEPTYDVYVEPFAGSYSVGLNMPYIQEMRQDRCEVFSLACELTQKIFSFIFEKYINFRHK